MQVQSMCDGRPAVIGRRIIGTRREDVNASSRVAPQDFLSRQRNLRDSFFVPIRKEK